MSDESKELTLRVHDECMHSLEFFSDRRPNAFIGNGSDVFGSDICTWCVNI